MDPSQQKEQFSAAYLSAVVAVAGYNLYEPRVDDDSVDWEIVARAIGDRWRRPRVEVQLKCTAQSGLVREDEIRFPLSIKNYDDLRLDEVVVPRILVVVLVPRDVRQWIRQTEEELALRHCGYWASLRGQAATDNTRSVTVSLPRSQQLTPTALQEMMKRINEGMAP